MPNTPPPESDDGFIPSGDGWSPFPSPEEIAFGAALAAVEAAERLAAGELEPVEFWDDWAGPGVPGDLDASGFVLVGEAVDGGSFEPVSDVAALPPVSRAAGGAELLALESIDPAVLPHDLHRVDYLKVLDRVAARVESLRHAAVVALAHESSSGAYLTEVHLETELAAARRTSRYAAGRAIETARALAVTFPAFAVALRDGNVSPAHCAVLVERTRPVHDPEVLARIEAITLPKAKRLAPGEFGRELS
jgi:hypothetical protein